MRALIEDATVLSADLPAALSYRDIADRPGSPPATVRIRRGRGRLRLALSSE